MNIEKEYILSIDDYVNFQYYISKKMQKRQPLIQRLFVYLPFVFIIFSSFFMRNFIVSLIGLFITLFLCIYYLIIGIYSRKNFKKYLLNYYYKNLVSDSVKIIITENSITEYYNNFEQKIYLQWIESFEENDDYIYLLNNKKYVIIIPKKYYSSEELIEIYNYYRTVVN